MKLLFGVPVSKQETIFVLLGNAYIRTLINVFLPFLCADDGYDYPFQVNYKEKWNQIVEAFQECCDEYPEIKWSLEFKPTDENTRFFTVPSTGAAVLLLNDINRPNMGLTLDVGHMLMAGENPGQSIAMVGSKLFGIQLNDGYTRLAAEDGMMFASVHPTMALEIMVCSKVLLNLFTKAISNHVLSFLC